MELKDLKTLVDELLVTFPPNTQVILSKDSEGNGYSPLSNDYSIGIYKPENTWSGEFHDANNLAEEGEYDDEDLEDLKINGNKAIVFWPIN